MKEDMISRQAAVNAIRLYECDDYKINTGLLIAMNLIGKVPSAQPETDTVARDIATILQNEQDMRVIAKNADIVRCGECKYYDAENHNCLDEMAYARVWNENDFCSFGERKDDELQTD